MELPVRKLKTPFISKNTYRAPKSAGKTNTGFRIVARLKLISRAQAALGVNFIFKYGEKTSKGQVKQKGCHNSTPVP